MRLLLAVALTAVLGISDMCSKDTCQQLLALTRPDCSTLGPPYRQACAEAKAELERRFPNGCPVPEPPPTPTTPPPTTLPGPPPTTPTPTPVPLCVIDFDTLELVEGGASIGDYDAAVKTAEANAHPEGCDAGTCLLRMSRPQWHYEVCQELRVAGLCCGYTDADQITVGTNNKPGAKVQNHQIFAGDPSGVQRATVRFPPQSRIGTDSEGHPRDVANSWTLALKGEPTPPPGPVLDACSRCPDPKPFPGQTVRFRYKEHGQVCDTTATFYAKDGPFADAGPFENWCFLAGVFNPDGSGALWCPARPEGHPDRIACEDCGVGGRGPAWRCEPAGCEVHLTDNPWQATASNASALYVCTRDMAFCQNVYAPKLDDPGTACR